MNDNIKVHIWQLPEKIDEVNKNSDYTVIYDGSTKKVMMEKLYEYFNQNYKIENIVRYFNDLISSINTEYNHEYSTMELSISNYEVIINELVEKFRINRNNIIRLESVSNQIDTDTEKVFILFQDIDGKYLILLETFDNYIDIVSNIEDTIVQTNQSISQSNNNVSTLLEEVAEIDNSNENINNQISIIKSNNSSNMSNNKDTLFKDINDEYDKILAIIDYYHHIHDDNIK